MLKILLLISLITFLSCTSCLCSLLKIFKNFIGKFCPPMLFSKKDYSNSTISEFKIQGTRKPTAKDPQPQLFVANVFAPNSVVAESKFWKILNKQYKIKQSNGIIARNEVVEQDKDCVVKNYGINFTYRTRTGLLNGYKEFRHITRTLAVETLYNEFGSKHKLNQHEFYIVSIKQLEDSEVTKARILSYVGKDVHFPIFLKDSNTKAETVPVSTNIFN